MSDSSAKTPYVTKAYKTYGVGGGQIVFWVSAAIAVAAGVLWILHEAGVLPVVNRFL